MSSNALIKRAESCLANIVSKNKRINAIVATHPSSQVLQEVQKQVSSSSSSKQHSKLQGRIVAIKDNYVTKQLPTTCASKVLKDFVSPFESTPTKLLQEAGAVIIGKCNMDEFAMGTNNNHSYLGKCLNPLYEDEEYSPGGSSGGSAAAVAADMCDVALGSDTGGSVRLPGAYCGVVGYKPSYGLISRNGVIAYAQSLDTVGILAKDVGLVEDTFDILNQYDENDPTCIPENVRNDIFTKVVNRPRNNPALNIGIMEEAIIDLSPEVREAWIDSLDHLRKLGHNIKVISIPSVKNALPTYFIISPAEASSNLARYDGIRYGYRSESDRGEAGFLYAPTRSNAFGPEVQRRILLGTYNLSSGNYGNHYEQAQKIRTKLVNEFDQVFASPNVLTSNPVVDNIDVLINPTTRTKAPSLYQVDHESNATDHYINDVLTVPANLAGLPAISVPWGKGKDSVGIQVIGQYGDDKLVLDVARMLEIA